MPLKKIKKVAKKVGKVVKATPAGVKDYSRSMKQIDKQAEKAVGKSGSRNLDIQRAGQMRKKLKKEKGVSLKNSIKKKMK